MTSVKYALIILFCFALNMAQAQQPSNKELGIYFDKLLAQQFKSDDPGLTVLVAKNGQILYEKAVGMANLESKTAMQVNHVFSIASVTKQFTAVAILQLMEQGKLNLSDEITKFIPGYPTQGNRITVEHLLTHTSGIHEFSGMPDPEKKLAGEVSPQQVMDFFKDLPMRFVPGTKWEYSNSGYFLLGQIIEKVSGKTYANYLEENFFKPLGMTNSAYGSHSKIIANRVSPYTYNRQGLFNAEPINFSHVYAAGGIQSTVPDLFKWQQALNSHKILKKETLDKAFSKYTLANGQKADYGYGWRLGNIYETPMVWHGGMITGYGTMQLYVPETGVYVAVFSNCDCNYPKDLSLRLAAVAGGVQYEYKELPLDKTTAETYTGVYENEKKQQRIITVSGNKLYSQPGRGPKSELKQYKNDGFYFEDPLHTLEFIRNKNGQIEKLLNKNLAGTDTWVKTNKPIPSEDGIKLSESILNKYVGNYQLSPSMSFEVTREQNKLFIRAGEQEKIELFAETETKFFVKVNDAEFEFIKDAAGNIIEVQMQQSGRKAVAKRSK